MIAIFACLIVNCTCQNQIVVKPLLLFDGKMVGVSNLLTLKWLTLYNQ